jgi:hypothetical protein
MPSPSVVPRSDGECEFSEGSREPMPGINVGAVRLLADQCDRVPLSCGYVLAGIDLCVLVTLRLLTIR